MNGPSYEDVLKAAERIDGHSVRTPLLHSPQINAIYRSFDTNARLGNYVSLEIPSGADVYDGQKFTISDGLRTVTFEYDDLDHSQLGSPKAGVAAGNVRIGFRDFESADLIAERVRDTRGCCVH